MSTYSQQVDPMQLLLVQTNTLDVCGGLTGVVTVFPGVEAWLAQSSDHQHALDAIKGRKSARRYRSVMDFLLCEVCPEERAGCFAFYRDEGPQLRLLRDARRIRFLESKLLVFLALAYEAHVQRRALSWGSAVSIVDALCAAA